MTLPRHLFSLRFWTARANRHVLAFSRSAHIRFCRLPGIRDLYYFPKIYLRRGPGYDDVYGPKPNPTPKPEDWDETKPWPAQVLVRPGDGRVHRYGVMPDGSEVDLGPTVEVTKEQAHKAYQSKLRSAFARAEWDGSTSVRLLAPIESEGTEYMPLPPVGKK